MNPSLKIAADINFIELHSIERYFSTRSQDRPNPIGMHVSVIKSVKDNISTIAALEVLDGTPVIDIKPNLD